MGRLQTANETNPKQAGRIAKLRDKLRSLTDGHAVLKESPECSPDTLESSLEDILAFESVGSGPSLFEGLQAHGIDLPRPDSLNELQSAQKVMEVLKALADLQIFLIGFDEMSARQLYSILFSQTLWEGCYVKKRHPGAMTLIDVSHKMSQAEIQRYIDDIMKADRVH
jgi:hypothetical protein